MYTTLSFALQRKTPAITFNNHKKMSDENIPQFDVVTDFSGHHYAQHDSNISTNSKAHKKITQEWKLLSKNLPDDIYVRVYETRIDLARAAIVGARGTPYHDGLFFFDIAFASNYPHTPPLVYYHSYGYSINPILYHTGKVCLSLLDNWSFIKSENWDPKNSNLLQVLLSIQASVLNEKPYFHHALSSLMIGNFKYKQSFGYNEKVFYLNCMTMLRVLKKPPKNFEPLVNQHFKDRAEFILNAFDAYRKGLARVGFLGGVLDANKDQVSVMYKEQMDEVFGNLLMAFSKNDFFVGNFIKIVEEEREIKAKEKEKEAANSQQGIFVKLQKVLLKTCWYFLVGDSEQ